MMALPGVLLTLALCASPAQVWAAAISQAHPCQSASFDYVIVGGGTAGLTLANRLTETPGVTVAVIEAGTFPEKVVSNLAAVPAYAGNIEALATSNTSVGWGFQTTPQLVRDFSADASSKVWKCGLLNIAVGSRRCRCQLRASQVGVYSHTPTPHDSFQTDISALNLQLGGCSVINDMAYSRGSKGAFQLWADTVGDQSYTWDGVLPYYKKNMRFTPPNAATRFANATPSYDATYTAQRGPLDIAYPAYAESWSTWVARALTAAGVPQVGAFISGTLNGATYQLLTVDPRTGHRASSDTAYLRPVLGRNNLVVLTETLAERVLFDSGKTATGISVSSAKCAATFTVTAKKEVILSAGVIQSPQLLMVSGVGPSAVLARYNITVVADRPGVGQGLLDHILIPLTWQVNLATPDVVSAAAVQAFDTTASGPLTNPGGDFAALAKIPDVFRTNWSASTVAALDALPADWPEVEYLVRPFAVSPGTVPGKSYASIFLVLQAPQSVGNVTIASGSMRDAPVIDPNWLTAQADLDVLMSAFRRTRTVAALPVLTGIVGDEFLPGPHVQTDEQILEYFRLAGTSIHHGHATCKMGKHGDVNAVVGPTGKVYGVRNRECGIVCVFWKTSSTDFGCVPQYASSMPQPFHS